MFGVFIFCFYSELLTPNSEPYFPIRDWKMMKVSLNWLKDYVDIRMDIKDLINLLTMAGLEVEHAVSTGEEFEKVVVAEIGSIRSHPNADRLSLVEANTGKEKLSIVCGGTNIRDGQKVPLALIGARLPNGVEIKRSKIRERPLKECSARRLNSDLAKRLMES